VPTQSQQRGRGLRERKKARTRAAIQSQALRLFQTQGYGATSMGQIAEAAEVSESTLFRYFPTKQDLVLQDAFDPLIVEAFMAQPSQMSPLRALRGAFDEVLSGLSEAERADLRDRVALSLSVPELRAAMLDQFAQALRLIAEVVAARMDRQPDDFAVRTLAGAVIGAGIAVLFALADDPTADPSALLDEAIAHLESGLTL
jgi:AcrR family transcriptional regulator